MINFRVIKFFHFTPVVECLHSYSWTLTMACTHYWHLLPPPNPLQPLQNPLPLLLQRHEEHGLQSWTEWVSEWKLPCRVWLFATPWAVQSMGFSRPEYWRRVPFSSPGDIPDPGIKPGSPALEADSLPTELPRKPLCPWVGPNIGFKP